MEYTNLYKQVDEKLKYVADSEEGIIRTKTKKSFTYTYRGKVIRDKKTLSRIKKIVIPPAWENVWICASENGHLQATGIDTKGRKQYRYHLAWTSLRSKKKFNQLLEFSKVLPKLRKKLKKDIAKRPLTKEHVLATVLQVMERTYIRVGNYEYEKLNGSYGLTTLKQHHLKVRGATMRFAFRGKKGIFHTITLKNKKLARIVKSCSDIPGKMLFQYIDDSGERHAIDSGMVNDYIKEATNSMFTTKDLRTWSGSLLFLISLKELQGNENDKKSNVLHALDQVSAKLGNTRNVCRNYYVHPGIVTCYEEGKLDLPLQKMSTALSTNGGLSPAEKSLVHVLKKCSAE